MVASYGDDPRIIPTQTCFPVGFTQPWALLEAAKNNYKDYSLQSRLHFRIHAAQNKIRATKETEEDKNPFQVIQFYREMKK